MKSISMIEKIEALVNQYERGDLTRRQLLQALAVISAGGTAASQTPNGLMRGRNLHHVNIRVSNVAQSENFYRKLFGLSPSRRVQGPDNHGLDLPGAGLIILQRADDPGRIDHLCVGVDDFNAERLRAAVRNAGLGDVQGNASDNFSVIDPDGLRVQISAPDWSA
jgi:catechol 2,3-dioxygenase-like lactoylglutathione lyase family enzyme